MKELNFDSWLLLMGCQFSIGEDVYATRALAFAQQSNCLTALQLGLYLLPPPSHPPTLGVLDRLPNVHDRTLNLRHTQKQRVHIRCHLHQASLQAI